MLARLKVLEYLAASPGPANLNVCACRPRRQRDKAIFCLGPIRSQSRVRNRLRPDWEEHARRTLPHQTFGRTSTAPNLRSCSPEIDRSRRALQTRRRRNMACGLTASPFTVRLPFKQPFAAAKRTVHSDVEVYQSSSQQAPRHHAMHPALHQKW